ncbi:MAG: cysteine desulfurase [Gammaproteobacteria bacterium]|nr:cysteine desulfurase [Gammaproteobacteria bacterium]
MLFDVEKIRQDFPILHQHVQGKPLVYFDNAATTQKPACVIEALQHYYACDNANVHRGVHTLSERSTKSYENALKTTQHFLGAGSEKEIIFTKGTTEGINLVAYCLAKNYLKEGDEILVSCLEHHANIVPWQLACEQTGCRLKVIPINDQGEILQEEYEKLLSSKTKVVAIAHVSNALGTINPIEKMIALAHQVGAICVIDGAQAVAHQKINVQTLDCDFYVFSGHKTLGPTGIGVLYGKYDLLKKMPPYQGGGDMIREVSFEKTTYNDLPYKFEAGTPPISAAIGLAVALHYLESIGLAAIAEYEQILLDYMLVQLAKMPEIKLIGQAKHRGAIVSFLYEGVHAHDVGSILDHEGVAIRNGHHCAMPLMKRLGVSATSRASLAFYNTQEEIDQFIRALKKVKEVFN